MIERIKLLLVTVGGLGLLKKAPGTWGSIPPAVALFALLAAHADKTIYFIVAAATALLASAACVALTPWSERRFGRSDPRMMVLDEVAGMAIAAMAPPAGAFHSPVTAAVYIAIAFALFRVFDIAKPGLIDTLQKLSHGWGVLLDDLAAGGVAMGILSVGWNLFL